MSDDDGWHRVSKYASERGTYRISAARSGAAWRFLVWRQGVLLGAADSFGDAITLAETDESMRGLDATTTDQA